MLRYTDKITVCIRAESVLPGHPSRRPWSLWVLEIKMRFVEGLRARQRAAIVIQQAWFEHVHGPLPGLIEADGHVWPLQAINPWMILAVFGNVEHFVTFDDMEEVD